MKRGDLWKSSILLFCLAGLRVAAAQEPLRPLPSVSEMLAAFGREERDVRPTGSRIAVFITAPTTKDGYLDVSSGVADSIRDITNELQHSRDIQIVASEELADVVLAVNGRGASGTAGAIAAPIAGGGAVVVPLVNNALRTTIRTALKWNTGMRSWLDSTSIDYDNCKSWRRCARLVAKDFTAWTKANRQRLIAER